MILFEFYLVLENVFALSACKFNEQKRPAKVFGDRHKGAFLRQQATCLCGSDTSGQIQFFSRLHKNLPQFHPIADLFLSTFLHLERATFMPLHMTRQTMHKSSALCVPEIIFFTTLFRLASANRLAAVGPLAPPHRHGHFDSSFLIVHLS